MTSSKFDPDRFILKETHFDHASLLHGINHTYRVMCHCFLLGTALGFDREKLIAMSAAFIHDMSRKHDGYCTQHGCWSSENKLPLFADFFQSMGINKYELEEIRAAVKNHSERFDLPKDSPFKKTTSILKDADALDRIRLGEDNLDPSYLRFEISREFIPFAKALFYKTEFGLISSFTEVFSLASGLVSLWPDNIRPTV